MFKKILAKIFEIIAKYRNKKYNDATNLIRCNVPVISVGNLSVGGTGKTPFVQMLSKYFISRNLKIGIVGRGYKRKSKGEIIVSDGINILSDADEAGDEMLLLANSLKIPIIADDDKSKAAKSMEQKFAPDLIIVDDGFQHRKLYRDIDIILLDRDTIENPKLLPEGRLREPLSSIQRADVIVLTGTIELPNELKELVSNQIIIKVKQIKANPYYLNGKEPNFNSLNTYRKGIFAFAGIARPDRFYDMLAEMDYKIINKKSYDDHHHYTKSDIENLIKMAKENNLFVLATTEKDAVKLIKFIDDFEKEKIKVLVFPIALTIFEGKDQFFRFLNKMFPKKN